MLFVTRSRYWRAGNGEAIRTRAVVEVLAGVGEWVVFFLEPAGPEARAAADASPRTLSAGARWQRTPRTGGACSPGTPFRPQPFHARSLFWRVGFGRK